MNRLKTYTDRTLSGGCAEPQGATPVGGGVNFSLYSEHAEAVYLLLYGELGDSPTDVIEMSSRTGHVWHVLVQGIGPGQRYAFRVDGEYDPARGLRFNPNKLLIDPYARALTHGIRNSGSLLMGCDPASAEGNPGMDARDSGPAMPRCIVVDDSFDWGNDKRPDIPAEERIVYEVHVKGFTAHPSSGVTHPGTYLGFAEKIPYLKELGVTAVELLPVQEAYSHAGLTEKGLVNYWGYNTVGFFAPSWAYGTKQSPACQVREFKTLVRELHSAGMEVLLDVVFNHTGEGGEGGPTVCFRGIDNPTYYRLRRPETGSVLRYADHSGTGNTLDIENPQTLRFVMDALRYWATTMHVDGFRFDLAPILGYAQGRYDAAARFFGAISGDPALRGVRLIAEPWDVTTYQLGNFPRRWMEWNDRFRDTTRRFWRGDGGQLAELGWRLAGSQDVFQKTQRTPLHGVNFVTCHDGFTLHDLFAYDKKHNEANLENNRDGSDSNHSWNCGYEGETEDRRVCSLRRRMRKNAICSLFFSMGTPMLLGGDEFGRTQGGNNNAYCQDNDVSWFDWKLLDRNRDLREFVRKAIAFRKAFPVFRRTAFLTGRDADGNDVPDVRWYDAALNSPDWQGRDARLLCALMDGSESPGAGNEYRLFLVLNADSRERSVRLPAVHPMIWHRVVDTNRPAGEDFVEAVGDGPPIPQDRYRSAGRSFSMLLAR